METRAQIVVKRDDPIKESYHYIAADPDFGGGIDRVQVVVGRWLDGTDVTVSFDPGTEVAFMQAIVRGMALRARDELARVGIVAPEQAAS